MLPWLVAIAFFHGSAGYDLFKGQPWLHRRPIDCIPVPTAANLNSVKVANYTIGGLNEELRSRTSFATTPYLPYCEMPIAGTAGPLNISSSGTRCGRKRDDWHANSHGDRGADIVRFTGAGGGAARSL